MVVVRRFGFGGEIRDDGVVHFDAAAEDDDDVAVIVVAVWAFPGQRILRQDLVWSFLDQTRSEITIMPDPTRS